MTAAWALTKIEDARAVEPLIELLDDPYRPARQQAAIALGELGDPRAIAPLISQLRYRERSIHPILMIDALAKFGDPVVMPLLKAYVEAWNEGPLGFLFSAASVIRDITDRRAIWRLIEILKHEDDILQPAVASALGKIKDARAVEPLISALKSDDSNLRWSIVKAVGEIGDPRAIGPLTQALKDKAPMVSKAAEESLSKIKNQPV